MGKSFVNGGLLLGMDGNGWEWEKIAIKIEISIFYSWENDPMNGGLSSKPRVMKPEGNSLDLINKMGM